MITSNYTLGKFEHHNIVVAVFHDWDYVILAEGAPILNVFPTDLSFEVRAAMKAFSDYLLLIKSWLFGMLLFSSSFLNLVMAFESILSSAGVKIEKQMLRCLLLPIVEF